MYDLCARVSRFCSVSHISTVFLRCHVKLKKNLLLHAVLPINVISKTVDQSEVPEGGQALQAFVYSSKLAWKLFFCDSNIAEKALIVAVGDKKNSSDFFL